MVFTIPIIIELISKIPAAYQAVAALLKVIGIGDPPHAAVKAKVIKELAPTVGATPEELEHVLGPHIDALGTTIESLTPSEG